MTKEGEKILKYLHRKRDKKLVTIEELTDHLDCGVSTVKKLLGELQDLGHNIHAIHNGVNLSKMIPPPMPKFIDVTKLKGRVVRFGATGDNHLGSRYCRLDVINALFDIWKREGVETVYQCGNMIDGEARFNQFDLVAHGVEGQVDYFVENWPKRNGVKTEFVTGDDHEGWYVQRDGIDIGRVIESRAKETGRDDLKYLGHMEADIIFKGSKRNTILKVIHAGGGSAYATSYTAQKIVESYQGGEKPNVLLIGHFHKAEYGYPREVHCVQVGCTEDQTPFMRKKRIAAHVGGFICEMEISPEGHLLRFKSEFFPFYDKKFYDRAWRYEWK